MERRGEFLHPFPEVDEPLATYVVRNGKEAETNTSNARCENIVHVTLSVKRVKSLTYAATCMKYTFHLSVNPLLPTDGTFDDERS